MDQLNIVVAQFYSDNLSYGEFSENINRRYCESHGYTYYVDTDTSMIKDRLLGRSWTWYKPHLISDVFLQYPECDYVVFLDIDAIFSTDTRRIEEILTPLAGESSILMSHDYGPSRINAGVIIMKNTEIVHEFITDWWEICDKYPIYKTALWHDQTCIGLLLDESPQYESALEIVPPFDINSRTYDQEKLIFHAFSYGVLRNRSLDIIHDEKFNIVRPTPDDLPSLAYLHNTDKQTEHNYYNRFYIDLLTPLKSKCDVLEIGSLHGESLRVWRDFFDEGSVHCADLNLQTLDIDELRHKMFLLDQSSEEQLSEFSTSGDLYDLIIDDGSHVMKDQQITIQYLFNNLRPGGIYVIEDLHTSREVRMPEKRIFGWGDPDKSTTVEMIESIMKGSPDTDYKTPEWDKFLSQISPGSIVLSTDDPSSVYSIFRKCL